MLDPGKKQYIADVDDTIEAAWSKIEMNRHRSVIVVRGQKVIGTLSDGDIRKALLGGRLLSAPVRDVMNINFVSLKSKDRKRASLLFKEKDVFLIPVVNEDFFLLDIIIK